MRNRIIVIVLLGIVLTSSPRLRAQEIPGAIVADPPVDNRYPPRLAMFTVPSHGAGLDAWLYIAGGGGSARHGDSRPRSARIRDQRGSGTIHPASRVERCAFSLPRDLGGVWIFQSSAIEDTAEVLRFLRETANAAKYHIDPKRLVMIGHSFGGFIAAYEAAHDPGVKAVAMIAGVNLGKVNADPGEQEVRLKRWETQLYPVRGATAADLFAEAERHAKDWDYVQWVDALSTRPVLLVEADDQNHADMEALASALRRKGGVRLEQTAVATDHSFSDHRIALQTMVVRWLERLGVDSPTGASTQMQPGSPESEIREALAKFIYHSTISTGKVSD